MRQGFSGPLARKALLSRTRSRVRLPGHAKFLWGFALQIPTAHASWIVAETPQDCMGKSGEPGARPNFSSKIPDSSFARATALTVQGQRI
jgi:hypothetical protein